METSFVWADYSQPIFLFQSHLAHIVILSETKNPIGLPLYRWDSSLAYAPLRMTKRKGKFYVGNMTGKIHSIESFGTVDGPGIRFVLFMQGCPMRCLYCHNPDTWSYGGKEITAEEAATEALKYKSYIKNGGVTVSGGEPLMQIEFVTDFFKLLKQEGIHTAVDTSGVTFTKGDKRFDELIKYTDLFLLDIKHIDEEEHKKLTGFSNKNTLEFAKYLSDNGKDIWIRHVLVTGVTDDDNSLKKLKEFIDGLKTVKKVELLPYHSMGEVKYENLGISYPLKGMQPPSIERISNAKRILNI